MLGETLYPLRQLKAISPERYARERAKYDDHPARRRIPDQRIPKLNCTRQDVLNFAPVHPHLIFRAWLDLGVTLPPTLGLRVPVTRIAARPAVLYQPTFDGRGGETLPEAHVTWFDPADYHELRALPRETLEGYAQLHGRRQKGAWFARLPHVLVRGSVSAAGLGPLDWSKPVD